MKIKLTTHVIALAIAISLYSCGHNNNKTGMSSVNKNLFNVAKEITKKCPMVTDPDTRLDSAVAFNEYMITYHYTVITANSKTVDLQKFKTNMETAMKEKYKTDSQLAIYRDNKIAIAYNYKDKTGQYLCYFICGN